MTKTERQTRMLYNYLRIRDNDLDCHLTKAFDPTKDTLLHTTDGVFEVTTWEDGGQPIMIDETVYFIKEPK